ncbi:MAG: ClpXP protease specificity-enhancing factor, partial [Pseudomonadota bacterium]
DANAVSSKRPYLLRAMHEWMSDNAQTPHVLVDASGDNVIVPSEHVDDGRIVLNVSYRAVQSLNIGNDVLSFRAQFQGRPFDVSVPVAAVIGIYAKETGQGMVFADSDPTDDDPEPPSPDSGGDTDSTRAHLKLVK